MDDLVKRIVGMPGETIEGRDGHVLIDGKVLKEPYLDAGVQSTTFGPVHVPANSYFMMGDNRQFSNDSTKWGPANRSLFVGPVFVTIWPLDRLDVPGWVWLVPIVAGIGGLGYLVVRKRHPAVGLSGGQAHSPTAATIRSTRSQYTPSIPCRNIARM